MPVTRRKHHYLWKTAGKLLSPATQRAAYVGKGAGSGWKGEGGVGGGGRCNLNVYDYRLTKNGGDAE